MSGARARLLTPCVRLGDAIRELKGRPVSYPARKDSMYRQRIHQEILYGQFREYMEIAHEVLARRQALDVASAKLWAPTVGAANTVVWEIDYPDLASYQRENAVFYSDEEAMKHWRALWQLTVQGSVRDELFEEAASIA
jgi:hypothetical protein